MDTLVGIIVGLAFIAFAWKVILLGHFRITKSYSVEIEEYLKKQNLRFKLLRKVEKTDWKNSPFKKPQNFKASIGTIKIGGIIIPMADVKYKIIETNENETIWLEIETLFLFSPKLSFKISPPEKAIKPREFGKQETFKCPACAYELMETDKKCPDCGLSLK